MLRFWSEYSPDDERFRRVQNDDIVFSKALFGGGSSPQPPPPKPVTPMPDMDDPAVLLAKKRAQADAQARSGRASTLLSGDSYSDDKLGTD